MKVTYRFLLSLVVLLGLAFLALPANAGAGELTWTTKEVHFEGDTLVIRGHFTNETSETVDRVNSFEAHARLRRHGEWSEHASGTFEDINVHIRPGDTMRYTFRIHDVEEHHFDEWRVRWKVSYHWHRHHGDERHWHQSPD